MVGSTTEIIIRTAARSYYVSHIQYSNPCRKVSVSRDYLTTRPELKQQVWLLPRHKKRVKQATRKRLKKNQTVEMTTLFRLTIQTECFVKIKASLVFTLAKASAASEN